METNLYSAYHLTRGLLLGMMELKKGHIFTICSTASIIAYPNGGSYCISKFALYGMTKVLREEMKPYNVRVTAILPGATYTDSWKGTDLPEERFMDSRDVAESIWSVYALSSRAVVEEILIRPQLGDLD
ncbi:Sepiapterin reductase [compost metagenome]